MKIRLAVASVLAGFVLLPAGVEAQGTPKAMTVFVTAAEVVDVAKIDDETRKRLGAAIQDAKKKRKDLEKTLKAQHGNKRENWPKEAEDAYADAEEAEALADADWEYRRVKQAGLVDSVEDIKRAVAGEGLAGKKDNITIVQTMDEAQLIIEVNGRRSAKSGVGGLRDNEFWISFLVKAGPKLSADRFAAVPRDYRLRMFRYSVLRLAVPRPESPYWRFEAFNTQRWGMAANAATILIEDFIAKNYDVMMAPAK